MTTTELAATTVPATTTELQAMVGRLVQQTGTELYEAQKAEASRLRAKQEAQVAELRSAAHKAQAGNIRVLGDLRRQWGFDK